MTTRYLLRGARGYVAGIRSAEWTANPYHAHYWVTPEAAHRAARAWHQNHGEQLSVIIRDTRAYIPTAS